jgi:hypothetical protein
MAGEVPVLVRRTRRAPSGNRLSRRESVSVLGVVLITRTGVLVSHRDCPWWWWSWSCGRVGVGAGRAFGPPIGFRRLAAVAELPDSGALASVWLVMLSASLLGVGGLAVWLSVLAGAS